MSQLSKVSLLSSSLICAWLFKIYASIDILPFFLCFLSLEYASKSFCKSLFISPALKLQRRLLWIPIWVLSTETEMFKVSHFSFCTFLLNKSLHHLFSCSHCVVPLSCSLSVRLTAWLEKSRAGNSFHLFLQFDESKYE